MSLALHVRERRFSHADRGRRLCWNVCDAGRSALMRVHNAANSSIPRHCFLLADRTARACHGASAKPLIRASGPFLPRATVRPMMPARHLGDGFGLAPFFRKLLACGTWLAGLGVSLLERVRP